MKKKLLDLKQAASIALADYNANLGAIQITEYYISELDKEEMNKPDKVGEEPVETLQTHTEQPLHSETLHCYKDA